MTLMCIERSQSPTHKGNFLQGGKSPSSNHNNNNNNNNNNINQQNANHHRRNSCSPPLSKQQDAIKSLNLDPSNRKLERSASEPDRRGAGGVQSNSSRYKTELCRPFEENGTCKYGDKCQFAHGIKELRSMARHPKYKTELCRTFHSTGLCPYGPRCHFIHNSEQSKKSLLTNLTGPTGGNASQQSPRPKALTSQGSAGDISPPSSHGGTPTGMKSFDDLYQQQTTTPLSPTLNNAFTFSPDITNLMNSLHQRFVENPGRDFCPDIYDSVSVFSEGNDNYNYQGGPVLDLFQTAPLTPSTPVDVNGSFFHLPVFDLFHSTKQQQQVI